MEPMMRAYTQAVVDRRDTARSLKNEEGTVRHFLRVEKRAFQSPNRSMLSHGTP
jgi:hypothetical protein